MSILSFPKIGLCGFCDCKYAWLWLKLEVVSSKCRTMKSCKMCLVLIHTNDILKIFVKQSTRMAKESQWDSSFVFFHGIILLSNPFESCLNKLIENAKMNVKIWLFTSKKHIKTQQQKSFKSYGSDHIWSQKVELPRIYRGFPSLSKININWKCRLHTDT